MASWIAPLLPLYQTERAAGRPLVLAAVLHTAGSTYRKAGALMLITGDGRFAGLLSGGCLESDLAEHARRVIETGTPRIVSYDLRNPDDVLWGLGVGCEGAMDILLARISLANSWEPLASFAKSLDAQRSIAAAWVVESGSSTGPPAGAVAMLHGAPEATPVFIAPDGARCDASAEVTHLLDRTLRGSSPQWLEKPALRIFATALALPPQLLLLGAGPDTLPLLEFGTRLGWKFTVVDHRPAYAQVGRMPGAAHVLCLRPQELLAALRLDDFAAAVVMSHHLPSDLEYLRALASSTVPYVGLLGPAARRERLLGDLGALAEPLRPRLRAPIGLAIGGRTPESIALAIVAELHAFLHGEGGGPFRGVEDPQREEPGASR